MSYKEDEGQIDVLRQHNRALRSVNRQLRRLLKRTQENADNVFLEVCNTTTEAEAALEEIRTFGKLGCGPGDYDYVVERVLDAFEFQDALEKSSHRLETCDDDF